MQKRQLYPSPMCLTGGRTRRVDDWEFISSQSKLTLSRREQDRTNAVGGKYNESNPDSRVCAFGDDGTGEWQAHPDLTVA